VPDPRAAGTPDHEGTDREDQAMAETSDFRDRFVLGVDLDGVVADFYGVFRGVVAEWFGVPVESLTTEPTYGLSEWGIRSRDQYEDIHRFGVTHRNLFRELVPLPGAPAALRRLSEREIRIRIITHRLCIRYFHEQAVTQTTAWLEHHGIPYWDLCFMKDKSAVGADLYIEDSPANIERLRRDGHETIVFSNSTNAGIGEPRAESWSRLEELVDAAHERWKTGHAARSIEGL
jgi:5'(3')-deoxyribonucleotidase